MNPIIRCKNLTKAFGDLVVLNDLNFEATPGEHLSIIGPSGSGKSTLLRVLMTLEKPDSGQVEIDGEEVWRPKANTAHLKKIRSKVSMVFQQFNLFPHMRVLQNLMLAPTQVLGVSKGEAREKSLHLLEMVGLKEKKDAYPHELSGGQKQRVAIARALASDPKILLFDEITSALDPELVAGVLEVLREIAHEGEKTMLLVTHHMSFARDISHRVLFFDQGKIVESGPPKEIFDHPQKERTQEFLHHIIETK